MQHAYEHMQPAYARVQAAYRLHASLVWPRLTELVIFVKIIILPIFVPK